MSFGETSEFCLKPVFHFAISLAASEICPSLGKLTNFNYCSGRTKFRRQRAKWRSGKPALSLHFLMSAGKLLKTAQALSWKVPISWRTLNLCLFPFSKVHIVQVLGTEATDCNTELLTGIIFVNKPLTVNFVFIALHARYNGWLFSVRAARSIS